jgi:hypothetical protein
MRFLLFIAVLVVFAGRYMAYSQCKDFAREECMPLLEKYIHDGNYNGIILGLDEDVELHKAFFKNQKYRVVVCREKHLPQVNFRISNSNFEVLYDNKADGFANFYDFELNESENLIISLKFNKEDLEYDTGVSGCVVILFGLGM